MGMNEIRFRILYECYQDGHLENNVESSLHTRIKNIENIPDVEKDAAQRWLIEEEYVHGSIQNYGTRSVPTIGRIISKGVNFVESATDPASTKIKDDWKDIS